MTPASGSKLWFLACFALLSSGAFAQEGSIAARFWNQPRGNPEGSAVLPLEPLRGEPAEAWRIETDELLAEPVSWGDVVFAASRDGRERALSAIRISDGSILATTKLSGTGPVRLVVWSGTVVVVDDDEIETYAFRQGTLKLKKRLKGVFPGQPCVTEGLLFMADGKQLSVLEIDSLRVLASREGGTGRPAVTSDGDGGLLIATYGAGAKTNYDGDWFKLYVTGLEWIGTKSIELRSERIITRGQLHERHTRETMGYVALVEKTSRADVKWFTDTHRPLRGPDGEKFYCDLTDGDEGHLAPIVTPAAIWKSVVIGFDAEGNLIRFHFDGKNETVVTKGSLPSGARPGPVTGASDVLYLGNWAADAASGRVLWALKSLEPATPLLPVADGWVVCGTKEGDLVGLTDRALSDESGTLASGPAAARGGPARPDRMPGVILPDGTVVLGMTAWLPQGGVVVETDDGRKQFQLGEFAYAETLDKDRRRGDEYPVAAAWRNVLDPEVAAMLEVLVRSAADDRFIQAGAGLLQEARDYGLPRDRVQALEDLLAGKKENKDANAPAKLKKRTEQERLARATVTAEFRQAATWCIDRGLPGAATNLLAAAKKIQREDATTTLAQDLVPAGFPWKGNADAATRWMTWAEQCVPAGAEFVPKTDPAWKGKSGTWQERALALRTRNLLFFTLEHDPQVIGPCLRKGEGTLRALAGVLNLPPPASDAERLEVHLFDTREAYLETSKDRELEWTSGFFSPAEKISRFYVPHDEEGGALERDLHGVMAHELVHHYLDQRWLGGQPAYTTRQPGYWIVEGFARFFEDQFLELGRAGRAFDDPTVLSIDRCSRISEQGSLIPFARLVLLDQEDFGELDLTAALEIQPRFTLRKDLLSERAVFYEQAGTLVFFLMNHSPSTRQALIDYLLAYYKGELDGNGWKRLGWESLVQLEADFQAFVKGLG
jgi:hypothetical protein